MCIFTPEQEERIKQLIRDLIPEILQALGDQMQAELQNTDPSAP